MTWEVRPCRQYAKGTTQPSFRVQRWIQEGHKGGYEMAFVHSDEELCKVVAALLNQWPEPVEVYYGANQHGVMHRVIQICIPVTNAPYKIIQSDPPS